MYGGNAMKKAIGLIALSLALEAGFLLQIALPARAPASTANESAMVQTGSGASCPAPRAAVVQAAALRPARG